MLICFSSSLSSSGLLKVKSKSSCELEVITAEHSLENIPWVSFAKEFVKHPKAPDEEGSQFAGLKAQTALTLH